MSADVPKNPNPLSDDDLTDLLRNAVGGEEGPREEFVAALGEQLEATLMSTLAAGAKLPSGTTVPAQESADEDSFPEDDHVTVSQKPIRSRPRRSLFALATTAVVVMAAVMILTPPSYSWASMLKAMERQAWIESTTDGQLGAELQAWFSTPNQTVVVRTGQDVVWDSHADQVRQSYVSGSRTIFREQGVAGQAPSAEQSLLSFLLKGNPGSTLGGMNDASGEFGGVKLLSQSWKPVGEGSDRYIELSVVLDVAGGQGEEKGIELRLTLDPGTQLPTSCEVVGEDSQLSGVVSFEYPKQGPTEVFDVGVPQDAFVVNGPAPALTLEPSMQVAGVESGALFRDTKANVQPKLGKGDVKNAIANAVVKPNSDKAPKTADASSLAPAAPLISTVSTSEEMSRRVDSLMADFWARNDVTPTANGGDEEFFRRVYLDLTGRIPTVSECREFQADNGDRRRERLVEQLLVRRDHATHLGAVWREILIPNGVDVNNLGGAAEFEEWLSDRFRDNKPYDGIVGDLLSAEGRVGDSGPMLFYGALNLKPEEIAAQTSRAFLGIRLECAQCHDHFFDQRLKQTDFWGFAAFFAQISQPEGKMNIVSPVLRVADTDVGDVTLPDSKDIVAPQFPLEASPAKTPNAVSRRQQLLSWIVADDNPHFARATVNRVWAHLFGLGLVEPVDDMRIDNPSLCPEVLDELAGYFVATRFDLRNLFRVLVNTKAYQLTSQTAESDPEFGKRFAGMNIKTFTAAQLYDSIAVATRLEQRAAADDSLVRFQNSGRDGFLAQFQAPPGQVTNYHVGIPQALTLMNGTMIHSATQLNSSGVLRSLQAPFFSDEQRVETLYLATLSRRPDESELQLTLEYIQAEGSDRNQRFSDVLWALLNSAEFSLNH